MLITIDLDEPHSTSQLLRLLEKQLDEHLDDSGCVKS